MPNGLFEWEPLEDGEITLGRIWGVLGVIFDRTEVIPKLVTRDKCELIRLKEKQNATSATDARKLAWRVAIVTALVTAALSLGVGAILVRLGV